MSAARKNAVSPIIELTTTTPVIAAGAILGADYDFILPRHDDSDMAPTVQKGDTLYFQSTNRLETSGIYAMRHPDAIGFFLVRAVVAEATDRLMRLSAPAVSLFFDEECCKPAERTIGNRCSLVGRLVARGRFFE
jgi:hypothetical protein